MASLSRVLEILILVSNCNLLPKKRFIVRNTLPNCLFGFIQIKIRFHAHAIFIIGY